MRKSGLVKRMKRNFKYLILSVLHYYWRVVGILLTLKIDVKFFFKFRRFPKKMSSEQKEEVKEFFRETMNHVG